MRCGEIHVLTPLLMRSVLGSITNLAEMLKNIYGVWASLPKKYLLLSCVFRLRVPTPLRQILRLTLKTTSFQASRPLEMVVLLLI